MATYQILYWKDIPAQIRVFKGRRPISRQMPNRFQVAIDRVAMKEGLASSEAYLDQWEWSEKRERPGDPETVLDALMEELEAEYDDKCVIHNL
jgi:hypothetical protein